MQSGTVTMLFSEKELPKMNDAEEQKKIAALKCPRMWRESTDATNLRTNFSKGRVNYGVEWGYLYANDCQICKTKNECRHRNPCKIFVMNGEEGVIKMKRMNVNAMLPIRGIEGAAGYDLAIAQPEVVPPHCKCLLKTGLAMALPPNCYGRIAPRSGLALKKFIDVGGRVIGSDYRGEIGVILFNFGDEYFIVNMGDRIAQLIFEKIKTPEIK